MHKRIVAMDGRLKYDYGFWTNDKSTLNPII